MQTNGKTQRPDKCQRGRGSSSQKTNKREIKETASSKRKKGIANHSNRRAAYRYMKSCCRFFSESCPALFILQRHVTYTGARQGSRRSNQACGPAKQEKKGVVSTRRARRINLQDLASALLDLLPGAWATTGGSSTGFISAAAFTAAARCLLSRVTLLFDGNDLVHGF